MNVNRTVNLNITEVINDINISYSTYYQGNNGPSSITMNASYNKPGVESRIYRTYTSDMNFTPSPEATIPSVFDEAFEIAVTASIENIFTNYATI